MKQLVPAVRLELLGRSATCDALGCGQMQPEIPNSSSKKIPCSVVYVVYDIDRTQYMDKMKE